MQNGLSREVFVLVLVAIAIMVIGFTGYQPTAFATVTSCIVLSDATNSMTGNISIAGNCLNISTPDIELDCNGFAIIGSASGSGIQINASNATIRNCIFDSFKYGINFTNVVNGTITNVTVHNATTSGIYLSNASNITITNVTISGLPIFGTATDFGIQITVRSNYTTVKNTTIKYIEYDGISSTDSNGTFVNDSFFISTGSTASNGALSIRGQSYSTTITFNQFLNPLGSLNFGKDAMIIINTSNVTIGNNTIRDFRNRGILIQDSFNITMRGNNVTNNSRNFNIVGNIDTHFNTHTFDESNVVRGNRPLRYYINVSNTTYSRTNAGFFACIQCSNITVDKLDLKNQTGSEGSNGYNMFFWKINDSTISNNEVSVGVEGIWAQNSTNVNITNNTIISTRIYLRSTTFSIVNGNNFTYSSIVLNGAADNITIGNNTFRVGGISLTQRPGNVTIINNTITTSDIGIHMQTNAANNYIYNNTIENNTAYGIRFQYLGSDKNIVDGNNITGNKIAGIYVEHGENDNITKNRFCYNGVAVKNDTVIPLMENNTFCVEPISPTPNNDTLTGVTQFTFNVTNPIFYTGVSSRSTSCGLWIDGSLKATNTSVGNNEVSTINFGPSSTDTQWQIYCNDSSGTNTGNSSVVLFKTLLFPSSATSTSSGGISCPTCPPATEWTVCKDAKQKRTTYACKGGKCVPSEETRVCIETGAQICPQSCEGPTPFSVCVNGKKTRTVYKCSPETLYRCQVFAEAAPCGVLTELQGVISSIEVRQNVLWVSTVIVFLIFSKWLTDIRKVKNKKS